MSGRAWALFAAVSVLWGFPYLFIKIAVDGGMPPLALAWARIALGAAVLVPIAWRAGTLGALRSRARWLAVFAVAEIAIPFPLIALGERTIESSTAAIVIATTPLIVALLAVRFDPAERVGASRLVGLVVGFAGVIALVGADLGGEGLGILAVGGAAVGYACGAMLLRSQLSDLDPVASMGAALAIATVLLAPFAAFAFPGADPSAGAIGSVLVLGLLATALALALMADLISTVGAGRAVVVTYVNPVIALLLGVIFLGESPGPGSIVGLLLILAGSWLSTGEGMPPGRTRGERRPNRLRGRWRPQPRARSASSSPSPDSTGTTAAPR
jgi:drug/metabolite transporter (DMT)-like permease